MDAQETLWSWTMRGLAVIGFIFTLVMWARGEPIPAFWLVLLIGLFFGPDAIRGQMRINRRLDDSRLDDE